MKEDSPQIPEPLGEPILKSRCVDSDHASNTVTRRSHTEILLFICDGLVIVAFSKRHNTVESASTFGSELVLVALRIARDKIVAIRIKLKFIGAPLAGPKNTSCDN